MVKRSERLDIVLQLAQRKEDEALERMSGAQRVWQAETLRLGELTQYHVDYQNQIRSASRGQVSASQLQSWQHFVSRLADAIAQQQQRVAVALDHFEQLRAVWRETYERRRGMERHIEACRQQEQYEEGRREQRQLDEAANNRYARRR
ncbi:flagellar export protein FliJ [Mangrovitalea sediminis]|uniref:flagellar export protein FliJ n=1 Tax=Mangrovitalea sediminis TaxID=1982043 RepID=UPI000BE5EE66|nr:flagellar export protein FliJ [Mangrovitalea sediminis]